MMSQQELKLIMRSKARLAKGYVNLLKDDAEYIYDDVDKFDIGRLEEDIKDIKQTATQLIDVTTDIEYYLYLVKQERVKNN